MIYHHLIYPQITSLIYNNPIISQASLIDHYKCTRPDCLQIMHFMGAAPGSTNIVSTLRRLVSEFSALLSLNHVAAESYKNLVPQFADILKECGEAVGSGGAGPLVVFIDGVDMLEDTHGARAMDWIPAVVPKVCFGCWFI